MTDMIRSGAERRAASAAAHSTAHNDSPEPSVPTTTGFGVIVVLLSIRLRD
jgi:hypothetical protein